MNNLEKIETVFLASMGKTISNNNIYQAKYYTLK